MVRIAAMVLMLTLTGTPDFGVATKTGLWKRSGYVVYADGKREQPELAKVCVYPDHLDGLADSQFRQMSMVLRLRFHNCITSDPKVSATGRENQMVCDGVTLAQNISLPDQTHLSFTTSSKDTSDAHVGTMTIVTNLEWLGDDCTGATSSIGRPPAH